MEELQKKKEELEQTVNNSIWDNSTYALTYKFQNGKDLWINGNAHFTYEIVIKNDRLMLKFFPNGKAFFIELKYGEILYLQDDKQQFELRFRERIK
ncbi:MAG: hypothetical protein PF448_07160 [Bacteroidales bacterium]|nr:hypothetical protein [Bacteroidales bacterium]